MCTKKKRKHHERNMHNVRHVKVRVWSCENSVQCRQREMHQLSNSIDEGSNREGIDMNISRRWIEESDRDARNLLVRFLYPFLFVSFHKGFPGTWIGYTSNWSSRSTSDSCCHRHDDCRGFFSSCLTLRGWLLSCYSKTYSCIEYLARVMLASSSSLWWLRHFPGEVTKDDSRDVDIHNN